MQNDVYQQRAALSVALAWMTIKAGGKAGRGFDKDISSRGSEPGWGHVLYIETPGGDQISYHFVPTDAHLLDGLPEYGEPWDGSFNGRETWWVDQYRPVKPVDGMCAAEIANERLSPVSLRRFRIEQAKLEADTDVTPEAREMILMGYATRWS